MCKIESTVDLLFVAANAWKLIHNLACKVQSLQDKEVTGYHRLPLTKHVFFDFKEHQAYHKNQNKPRLGLSQHLVDKNQPEKSLLWLASLLQSLEAVE